MNLGISIANLLRRYPAVEVSGIGVFRRNHQPASYDSEKSLFTPPVDDIELVEDTAGAFPITAYLAAQQQLDEHEATLQVEQAVADVMGSITRNGEALLDGLGYLVADGATFIFRPFRVEGLAAEPVAAPLPAVVEEPLPDAADDTGETITAEPEVETVPEPEVVPEAEIVPKAASEVSEVKAAPPVAAEEAAFAGKEAAAPDEVAVGEETSKRSTPWVVGGVVAVLLVAAIAVWQLRPAWLGIHSVEQSETAEMPVPPSSGEVETGGSTAGADSSAMDAATTGLATTGAGAEVPADTTPVAVVPPAKPSVTYEIIVGSFATMQQAHKFVAEMKAKGYDNLEAIDSRMPGNRKKVSWGSYATEEEAYKELTIVQRTFEPGAWIAKVVQE